MVEEGLFDKFPCDEIFGLHNWPGMPVGSFGVRLGPIMAAFDVFEITIQGQGSHAAKPQLAVDPILIASHLVTALQSIVSRKRQPMDQAVLSVTQIRAGDTWNVIPESATLRGTVRTFLSTVQDQMERRIHEVTEHLTTAFGGSASIRYERRYPATVNEAVATQHAAKAAADVVGERNVDRDPEPSMGAEDFAFMLQRRPVATSGRGMARPTVDAFCTIPGTTSMTNSSPLVPRIGFAWLRTYSLGTRKLR